MKWLTTRKNWLWRQSFIFRYTKVWLKPNKWWADNTYKIKLLNTFPSRSMLKFHPYCVSMSMKFTEKIYKKVIWLRKLWDNFFWYSIIKIHLSSPMEKSQNQSVDLSRGELYLNSEENSLGAIIYHWYDGIVDPFNLKISQFHALLTFFQCVASNLAMSKMCNVSGVPCAP